MTPFQWLIRYYLLEAMYCGHLQGSIRHRRLEDLSTLKVMNASLTRTLRSDYQRTQLYFPEEWNF
jgi:hypothetical protein